MKLIKDISIDDAMNCKDKVFAEDVYHRFCINKNCECVWSQYETAYILPYFDELKKMKKQSEKIF